jgi:hypothetical protein
VFFNETRWEGRFLVVTRLVLLRDSVGSVFDDPILSEWWDSVSDFLQDGFFDRLIQYSVILGHMNQISLLFHHQGFPTGMMVPLAVLLLYDPPFLQDFKQALRDAVDRRMGHLLTTKNNFLKAALLFPTIAKVVIPHVTGSVINSCFTSILDDPATFHPEGRDFLSLSLESFRKSQVTLWPV